MKDVGDIYIKCTITFVGKVRATLREDPKYMDLDELVHDIIHSGDYDYAVQDGDANVKVENVETIDDWEDYKERG